MGDEEEVPVEWPPLWDANANDQVEIEESEEQASVKEALNAARAELEKANQAVLAMRNKIAELKTYKVEPKCAEVIHAAFALLGTDPKEVADWNELRRRLTPEFFNSLTSFNDTTNAPSRKNEKAAARLVEALDEETVKQSSEALLALYNWVTAGRKLLTEASQLRATLTELAGKVPEDLTGDLYLDYEAMCTTLDLAPHPHLLPRKQCKKQRIADAPEPDPKAKGAPEGIAEELQCHSLTVSGLRLDYGSMVSLARCLPSCTTCCKIELWNTNLNDATVAALATVLPATAVTHLSLDWSLKGVQLKTPALQHLMEEGSCKLESLSLRSNDLGEKETLTIVEMMAANSTLTVLDLSNNPFSEEAAAHLVGLLEQPTSALTGLSLNSCELTDSFAAAVGDKLSDREYTEEEAAAAEALKAEADEVIARNESLKKGAAPEPVPVVPEVTTDAEGKIRGPANRTLVEMMLENNNISLAGVQKLASCISGNAAVRVLYLKHNDVEVAHEELIEDSRIFLSESKAARDGLLASGLPVLAQILEAQVAYEAPEPVEGEDEDPLAVQKFNLEACRAKVSEHVTAESIVDFGGIATPAVSMQNTLQCLLSLSGADSEVTEDWGKCCELLRQSAGGPKVLEEGEEPCAEGAEESEPLTSPILDALLNEADLTELLKDPETSLCARYYLDCVNWIEKKRAAPKEGPALRGSSLQAHIIEEYLVALVTLIDKEKALPVPAEPEEEEEPAAEETEEAPAE